MDLENELFGNDSKYIFLVNSPEGFHEQAVFGKDICNIICIADEKIFPDELLMVDGVIIQGTGLFVSAFFTTTNGNTDYCFQKGKNNKGEIVSTLVKVVNLGRVNDYNILFHRKNQVITEENELLEASYLAIYKGGRWFVLDPFDRNSKLDCESEEVLKRAHEYVFPVGF